MGDNMGRELEIENLVQNEIILNEISAKEAQGNYSANCITGDNDNLLPRLKEALKKAKRVDIIVSFLMESGVRLLEQDLKELVHRNIPIRILTGNYLNITQPQALYLIKGAMGDKVDLRFYNVRNKSFHPKAYIFEYEQGGDIFIGSSNISRSALTTGIEWNYRIIKEGHEEDFKHYKEVFEDLFLNHADIIDEERMREYSKHWKRPKVLVEVEDEEDSEENQAQDEKKVLPIVSPKGAQIEALYELEKSRLDGADKALVVAATGIGKTYLSAFDSKSFERILFVAHREEILTQAEASFKRVRGDIKTGFFGNGKRDVDCEVLFATVQTLGQSQYLNEGFFSKDYFDYVIIDEFHHAAAGNYQNIINYFNPRFLLGLTATPERLDNKDVFALCDYNVVYEVRLRDAINKGWLVPFRYYGIYDDTQYENVEYNKGKYNERQLEEALMVERRGNLIFNHYNKYKSHRALGFCSSKNHAEYMARYFNEKGVKACSVYSGELGQHCLDRKEAIEKLQSGELKVIFSVDMFNEGLDIPSVDLVMLLRPTESPTVFLQQLGRGLRKYKDKKYLNVLDFIGNYKKSNLVPFFLTGDPKNAGERAKNGKLLSEDDYPEDCLVDFQLDIIDIFKRQASAEQKIMDLIKEEYYRIKEDLNHRPSRLEMFTYIDDDIYSNLRKQTKNNIFKNYFQFLEELEELTDEEKSLKGTIAGEFINMIENTSMSKTYKMPVLLAFYNEGNLKLRINEEDIYNSFKSFYSKGSNSIDLLNQKSTQGFKNWDIKEWYKLAKDNPMNFLAKTHSEFFYINVSEFCLNEKLREFSLSETFMKSFKDAIDLRTREYYKNRFENKEK